MDLPTSALTEQDLLDLSTVTEIADLVQLSFVKTGRPSRAEITDAAMSERAECVMLNKGPYIIDAVLALDDILGRMAALEYKKSSLLRHLHSWHRPPG
jgi:pyruvate kinase